MQTKEAGNRDSLDLGVLASHPGPIQKEGLHVLPALKENARHGFWNGFLPPIDRRQQRGAKVKKKLEIDPRHADTVPLIYQRALACPGGCSSGTNIS